MSNYCPIIPYSVPLQVIDKTLERLGPIQGPTEKDRERFNLEVAGLPPDPNAMLAPITGKAVTLDSES